jgi:uncharacterized coiled-coil protein SlyX
VRDPRPHLVLALGDADAHVPPLWAARMNDATRYLIEQRIELLDSRIQVDQKWVDDLERDLVEAKAKLEAEQTERDALAETLAS